MTLCTCVSPMTKHMPAHDTTTHARVISDLSLGILLQRLRLHAGSVRDSQFVSNVAGDGITIDAVSQLSWFPCQLGEWMPTRGAFAGDVLGCNDCPERFYGDATNFETATCSGICSLGHFCEKGSALPVPCPNGTRMPLFGASSADDCLDCPRGPGSHSSADCQQCPRGINRVTIVSPWA